MFGFEVGDTVKHRQTKNRTWEVASWDKWSGRLVLQRHNARGRLIERQVFRPEEYRVISRVV